MLEVRLCFALGLAPPPSCGSVGRWTDYIASLSSMRPSARLEGALLEFGKVVAG
jgi:hypothetical protein